MNDEFSYNLNPTGHVVKVKYLPQLDVLLQGINQETLVDDPSLPSLEKLLAMGHLLPQFDGGAETWLCHAFGIARQQDDPVAAYAALGDGLAAEDGYWLRADPVYLHLARDRIVLLDGALPDIGEDDARRIAATLNAHFPDMQFFAPHPRRWYLRLPSPQAVQTCPLEQAIGRDVNRVLPTGPDAKTWMVRLNEVQMLLHEHPVNHARTEAGKLPINSIWLWGGGIAVPLPAIPYSQVWGGDALVAGVVTAKQPLPAQAEMLWAEGAGRGLLVLDVAELDWDALESRWLAVLERALKRGKLARLNLHIAHGGRVYACTVTQGDCWRRFYRVWMRRPRLQAFLQSGLA